MSTSSIDVAYVANLARLELTEEELAFYSQSLCQVLDYVAVLQQYDVEGVEPMFHAMPVFDRVREDVATPGMGIEAVLQNAPAHAQDQIRVPKVVESA